MGGHLEVSSWDKEKDSDEEGDAEKRQQQIAETFSNHEVRSARATVTVRQLRSEGLSFQLWPAANALCLFIDKEYGETGMSVIDARPPHLERNLGDWYSSFALEKNPVLGDSFSKGIENNLILDDEICPVVDSKVDLGDRLEHNGTHRTDSNGKPEARVLQDIERPSASLDIRNQMDPMFANLALDDTIIDSTVGLCERNGRNRTDSKDRLDAQILLERPFACRDVGNQVDPGDANSEATCKHELGHTEGSAAHIVDEFQAPRSLGTDFSTIHFPMRRMRVLELGSGTGMVGIVAACLGADVVLTDLPHVIPNISYNLDLNRRLVAAAGGSVEAKVLRWGFQEDVKALGEQSFDLILASDCVYQDTSYKPFLQTLNWLMALDADHTNTSMEPQKPKICKGMSGPLLTPLHGTELLPLQLLEQAVCLSPRSKRLMLVADITREQPVSRIGTGRRSGSNKPELSFDSKEQGERRRGGSDCVILLGHMRRWKKDSHFFRMAAKCFDVDVVYRHPPEENDRIGPIVYRMSTKSNRKTSSCRSRSSSASIISLSSCSPSPT